MALVVLLLAPPLVLELLLELALVVRLHRLRDPQLHLLPADVAPRPLPLPARATGLPR